jgi:hypothetical protein
MNEIDPNAPSPCPPPAGWFSHDWPFREPEDNLLNWLWEEIVDAMVGVDPRLCVPDRAYRRYKETAADIVRDHRDRVEKALPQKESPS